MNAVPPQGGRLIAHAVRALIAQSCGLVDPSAPGTVRQIIADYLRHALNPPGDDLPSVHVHRLVGGVRRQLDFLWDVADPDPTRGVLDDLIELREVANAGEGFYLPVPQRRIHLPGGGVLLIGSWPTRYLERRIGLPGLVRVAGLGRTIEPLASLRLAPACLPEQAFDSWLGSPALGLADWTARRLQQAAGTLASVPEDVGELRIYLPEVLRGNVQRFRWATPADWSKWAGRTASPSRLYLCRISDKYGARHCLARLRPSPDEVGAVIARATPVEPGEVRRLRYGFDLRATVPVRATFTSVSDQSLDLEINNPLPSEETRILTALTVRTSSEGTWPLRFRLDRVWRVAVEGILTRLAIRVE